MQVTDFTHDHIPEAIALARANYEEERRCTHGVVRRVGEKALGSQKRKDEGE